MLLILSTKLPTKFSDKFPRKKQAKCPNSRAGSPDPAARHVSLSASLYADLFSRDGERFHRKIPFIEHLNPLTLTLSPADGGEGMCVRPGVGPS